MLKKIMITILTLLSITSCSSNNNDNKPQEEANTNKTSVSESTDQKKTITVTTTFLADMVNELIGDKANVELIIPAGGDPHIYEAKPEDYTKITDADLVLYHGLHFEGKMMDALENSGYAVTSTFSKDKIGEMDEDGKTIEDPHFWFDIDLYKEAFKNTADKLKELYADDDEMIKLIDKNYDRYAKELDDLDQYIKDKLDQLPDEQKYLITPHDAFNYFSRRYDIKVMAPQGVTTESEVSNKDLEDTAQFIADHKIKAVFSESTTNPERMEKLADIVKSKGFETKVVGGDGEELFSDSLAEKGKDGDNYIDMYKHNIDLIVDNLK